MAVPCSYRRADSDSRCAAWRDEAASRAYIEQMWQKLWRYAKRQVQAGFQPPAHAAVSQRTPRADFMPEDTQKPE